jgi:RES domain-containing protein
MIVHRIVKSKKRTTDLSGMGAFNSGGRWNNPGVYALYCSESSSLAYLENLVHFDSNTFPPQLFIIKIEVADQAPIYHVPDDIYPSDWLKVDLLANKKLGDDLFRSHSSLGIRFRSAINPEDYNILLDPLYPDYQTLVRIIAIKKIDTDPRLI